MIVSMFVVSVMMLGYCSMMRYVRNDMQRVRNNRQYRESQGDYQFRG